MNDDFRVGSWLVAPSLNTISCKGTTVRLEPKVMGVLLCLAKHAGETLSKETIFHAVWPDTFVTDDVLTHSISELRRAFEDDARETRIIQTIQKRGYRLLAPVSAATAAAAPVTLASSAAAAGIEDEAIRHACEAFKIRDPYSQIWLSKYWPSSTRLYMYSRFREIIAKTERSDWLRD